MKALQGRTSAISERSGAASNPATPASPSSLRAADVRDIARKVTMMKLRSQAIDAIHRDFSGSSKGKGKERAHDAVEEDRRAAADLIPESVRQELDSIEAEEERYRSRSLDKPQRVVPLPKVPLNPELLESLQGPSNASAPSTNPTEVEKETQEQCCDVKKGKEEVKEMITSFIKNLDKMMGDTFADPEPPVREAAATPRPASPEDVVVSAFENPQPKVHTNIICDVCEQTVVGTRNKCLDCPGMSSCPFSHSVTRLNLCFLFFPSSGFQITTCAQRVMPTSATSTTAATNSSPSKSRVMSMCILSSLGWAKNVALVLTTLIRRGARMPPKRLSRLQLRTLLPSLPPFPRRRRRPRKPRSCTTRRATCAILGLRASVG